MYGLHHALQYGIEEVPGLLWITIGQKFHGAFEVSKQHRDLLTLAFEGATGSEDLLGEVGWCVSQWGMFLVWYGREARGSSRGVARPHQHLAILVPGKLVYLNDFVLEECEQVVVELELHLQGAIGNTA
jgi:hypothetical protein